MIELFFVLVFILVIVLFAKYCGKYCGTAVYSKGYGSVKEPINTLIDRIDWANNYKGRVDINSRYLIYSLVITFCILSVTENRLPSVLSYIRGVLIMFILLRTFHFYLNHHAEKFPHYAIDRNIKILRKKMKLKKSSVQDSKYKIFPGSSSCWNFSYQKD
jgi:hypothetical protein